MKRIFSILVALVAIFTVSAQSPEAIREIIHKNPNFSLTTVTTYQNVTLGEVAPAPKGYKPFYFSMVSRHGSRYELRDTTYIHPTEVYNRAAELGILTPLGEEVRQLLIKATADQVGKEGELSALGQKQLRGVGRRTYKRFKRLFDSGSIEGKASTKMRCVFSMVAFVDGLKEGNSTLPIEMEARESYLPILRPMADNPDTPQSVKDLWASYAKRGEEWKLRRAEWANKQDISSCISKLVTRPELLVEKCGAHSLFLFANNTHHLLLFAENFEMGNRELMNRIFSEEEMYLFYIYHDIDWLHWSGGWGNPVIEAYSSYLRPMVEDVLNNAQLAIEGKNPNVANLRFTHDTYLVPLLTIFGYENCALRYNDDWERGVTSAPLTTKVPMGANLQLVFYRNKEGKVLVRSLLNENDVFLPVECDTAPFYPWETMCEVIHSNLAKWDKSRKIVEQKYNLK